MRSLALTNLINWSDTPPHKLINWSDTTPPHLPHHHISQSFDLAPCHPTTFTALPCYCVTALVSHLTCPLPPHNIYCITMLLCHCISQSFDLPPATPPHLPHYCITALPHYHITVLVSHLTCPLPPHHIYRVTA